MIGDNFDNDAKLYRKNGEMSFLIEWRIAHDGANVPAGYLQALRYVGRIYATELWLVLALVSISFITVLNMVV